MKTGVITAPSPKASGSLKLKKYPPIGEEAGIRLTIYEDALLPIPDISLGGRPPKIKDSGIWPIFQLNLWILPVAAMIIRDGLKAVARSNEYIANAMKDVARNGVRTYGG